LACQFIELLNSSIFSRRGRRFVLPVSPASKNSRVASEPGREFKLKRDSPLDGIIAYLTSKCGGNVHDRGVVDVTAISIGSGAAQNVADLQDRSLILQSKSTESNPWVCYDFKNLQVTPTHYAVLSYPCDPGVYHPKSWYLEGSYDGTTWTVLHECSNNTDLNGKNLIGQYAVSKSMKCRLIRIRQTEHHCSRLPNAYYLSLAGFELHGILHEQ
jgi:hypothetical protein